ncbi:MAG: hypothetical protein KIT43_11630 [Bauldia sp.]|nr:hypothetical protein [Bauldia sp.]
MSLATMVRPGSTLRVLAFAAAALTLAACGDDAATPVPVTDTAPVTPEPSAATPAPVITPAPATTPTAVADTTALDTTMLLGDWAPDAATCSQGMVMTVGNNGLGGAALGVAQCVINSRTREGDAVTVVAVCSSPDTAFRSVTMTLRATVVGDTPPATMTILQQGEGLAEAATLPFDLIRCAAAPTP